MIKMHKSRKCPASDDSSRAVTEVGRNTYIVGENGLSSVDERQSLFSYLIDLLQRWPFIWFDARSRAFQGNKGSFLGSLWLVIEPLLQVGLYAVVFGLILRTNRGMDNFIGFLVIGVVFFRIASQGITDGSGLIRRSRALISSFSFPRMSLAVATTVRQFLDNLPSALTAIVVAKAFEPSFSLNLNILLLVPILLITALMNLGFVLVTARATAFVPDLMPLFTTLVRGLFFLSGVFYSIDRFETHPAVQEVVRVNPIYRVIELVREIVLNDGSGSANDWLYVSFFALSVLAIGIVYFWRAESRYAGVV